MKQSGIAEACIIAAAKAGTASIDTTIGVINLRMVYYFLYL